MTTNPARHRAAFSLIELLVVCGIIAVIAAFAIPASVTMMRGSQLTQGSQVVTDQISLARQTALTKNRSVEVRFYRYGDPESPGEKGDDPEKGRYRGLQLFEITENGAALPLGRFQRLPSSIVMNVGSLSTLVNPQNSRVADREKGDPELGILPGGSKWKYKIISFRFLPDGSTDLKPAPPHWFLTIHGIEDPEDVATPPANFFTLQVDPINGSTKSYRPNAG